MTIGQADTINNLYKSYNDTIIAYKDSLKSKTIKDDSILNVYINKASKLENYKYRYEANLEVYQTRERELDKMDKYHAWQKIILIFLIVFQFSQL